MKLSLCMIVKDEAEDLRECLDSVVDHVDEVVIVDTGSTDGTQEIAKEYADIFDEIEWEGFAHARNHSIDLATGGQIFILDADERVLNPELLPKMKEHMEEHKLDAIAIHLLNDLPVNQMLQADVVPQVRMFPKRDEIRYIGRVHNQIAQPLEDNPRNGEETVYDTVPLQVQHKGYAHSSERLQAKYRARIEGLKEEVEYAQEIDDPRRLNYYRFQTANAYFMLKDYDVCLAWVREIEWEKMTVQNAYSASIIGCHSAQILALREEAFEYAQKMLEYKPHEGLSFLFMGNCYVSRGYLAAGYAFLGAALAQAEWMGDLQGYKLDRAYVAGAAGECALKMQRYKDAKLLFREYLATYPDDEYVRDLESKIVTEDSPGAQEIELGEGEEISIPVSETTHSQPQSGQNHLDETVPI